MFLRFFFFGKVEEFLLYGYLDVELLDGNVYTFQILVLSNCSLKRSNKVICKLMWKLCVSPTLVTFFFLIYASCCVKTYSF